MDSLERLFHWLGAHVGIGRLWSGLAVTVGTGHVEDDLYGLVFARLGVELVVDGGKGAEELVGDVGERGGAACGDFIFGEEEKKASEEFVDGDSGAELLEVGGEDGGSFRGVLLILGELGVGGAVHGIEVTDVEAATLAVGETMCATSGVVDGAHPGGNAEDFENKRVAGKAIRKTMKTKGRQIRGVNERGV